MLHFVEPEEPRRKPWQVSVEELLEDRTSPPEPLEWQPPTPVRTRLWRAISAPIAAGIVVLVIAAVVAVAALWVKPGAPSALSPSAQSSPSSEQVEHESVLGTGQGFAGSPTAERGDTGAATHVVFVHVVGEVKQPGLFELPADARVADAIEAAGGATEAAVLAHINLAKKLTDGEQVVVPNAESAVPGAGAAAGAAGAGGSAVAAGGPVNLNTADEALLETLPKVGPALARRIVAYREANGGFRSTEQLLDVSGIGPATFEQLKDQVTV